MIVLPHLSIPRTTINSMLVQRRRLRIRRRRRRHLIIADVHRHHLRLHVLCLRWVGRLCVICWCSWISLNLWHVVTFVLVGERPCVLRSMAAVRGDRFASLAVAMDTCPDEAEGYAVEDTIRRAGVSELQVFAQDMDHDSQLNDCKNNARLPYANIRPKGRVSLRCLVERVAAAVS